MTGSKRWSLLVFLIAFAVGFLVSELGKAYSLWNFYGFEASGQTVP